MNTTHTFRTRGFSLIELLIVVVIIGLLSGIATTSYLKAQVNARDDARKADLHAIATAVNTYYAAQRQLPGKVSVAESPIPNSISVAAYNSVYGACESIDAGRANSFHYYYQKTPSRDCTTLRPLGPGGSYYNPDAYKPAGTWIPGLGSYLSPFPIEKRYLGDTGKETDAYADILSNTRARSYAYRHLAQGFMVYGRMEGNGLSSDSNFSVGTPTIQGSPALPDNDPILGTNLYIIRQ